MNNSTKLFFVLAAGWLTTTVSAQDRIHYTGTELSNPAYHDGGGSTQYTVGTCQP